AIGGEAGTEAVMPLVRGSGGRLGVTAQGVGHTEINVTVINNVPNATASVRKGNNDRDIVVVVDEMTASNLRRPGSKTQQAMASTFGQQPIPVNR
ncbi:hypothetical protein LCGC14_2745920, partial [marine sediment metagenome]